jgi:hypothetical protein
MDFSRKLALLNASSNYAVRITPRCQNNSRAFVVNNWADIKAGKDGKALLLLYSKNKKTVGVF